MRNVHKVVIYYVRKVVGRKSVRFEQHVIVKYGILHRNIAENLVMEGCLAVLRHLLTDYIRYSRFEVCLDFLLGELAAMSVILCRHLHDRLTLTQLLKPLLCTKAIVRVTRFDQFFRVFLINRTSFALNIRAVVAADVRTLVMDKTRVLHRFVYHVNRAVHISFLVGVLYSEDEFSALGLCYKVRIKRSSKVAYVHITCGAGCKSRSYFLCFHFYLSFLYVNQIM